MKITDKGVLLFWCEGCLSHHGVNVETPNSLTGAKWTWNNNLDKPTISPSILVHPTEIISRHGHLMLTPKCHSFIRDGMIEYLPDCTHHLAGKTIPLGDEPVNPEIKKLWVEALRSGDYVQGKGRLKEGGCFCVMGVLCDLHAKATEGKWDHNNEYLGCRFDVPVKVRYWASLETEVISFKGYYTSPMILNDTCKDFKELANIIEEQL